MNDALFERLLYEDETTTLDFKQQQYLFPKATEVEKSELLKDILGFANAWRRSDAYILIGVEGVRRGRGNVIGIPTTDHLDDHSLQQFVNSLTDSPVRFHYEAFGFDGKQVGIICIDAQQLRPVFLKKDYGKLKRNEVYIRRGSSTDPTKPAGPTEIAQMGHDAGPQSAELVVEFADADRDTPLTTHVTWDIEYCKLPPMKSIPDLVRTGPPTMYIDEEIFKFDPFKQLNTDYYRELATYEFVKRLFQPARLVVTNVGQTAANSVRVELIIPANLGAKVMYAAKLPDRPKRHYHLFDTPNLKGIRSAFQRGPGDVSIDENDERFRIEIECGDLQPGRRVWSEKFYVSKGVSGDLPLIGQMFAENLPKPKDVTLVISFNVAQTRLSVKELTAMSESTED